MRASEEGRPITVAQADAGLFGVDVVEDALVPDLALGGQADEVPDVRLRGRGRPAAGAGRGRRPRGRRGGGRRRRRRWRFSRHGRQRAGEARARDARRCWDEETLAQAAGADPVGGVGALALLAALY